MCKLSDFTKIGRNHSYNIISFETNKLKYLINRNYYSVNPFR